MQSYSGILATVVLGNDLKLLEPTMLLRTLGKRAWSLAYYFCSERRYVDTLKIAVAQKQRCNAKLRWLARRAWRH